MIIKRERFNFYRDPNARIFLNCCAFDKLLDVNIELGVYGGFQLDVSYLSCDDMSRDKQFIFLIRSEGDKVDEEYFNGKSEIAKFLKVELVRVSNIIENFYVFYFEIKPPRELRDNKISELTQ